MNSSIIFLLYGNKSGVTKPADFFFEKKNKF